MCISQNNLYKQHHTMNYLQKPVTYLKSLVHLSKVRIYANEHISAIKMKSPCVIVHKQESKCLVMLSVKQCTLLVLPDVNYGNILDESYCIEQYAICLCMPCIHFKSTNLHITVCGILIERDCIEFLVTLLLVV